MTFSPNQMGQLLGCVDSLYFIPKTAKHGGARKNGGRKSKSGEFSNDKTPEEKLKSHR